MPDSLHSKYGGSSEYDVEDPVRGDALECIINDALCRFVYQIWNIMRANRLYASDMSHYQAVTWC